jgi:hypothetical protein
MFNRKSMVNIQTAGFKIKVTKLQKKCSKILKPQIHNKVHSKLN